MSITSKFLKNVEKHRNNKPADKFKGYLADYLLLVEADPLVANLAHKRLYTQMMSYGLTTLDETDDRCRKLFDGDDVKVYNYFSQHFFGMERPLEKVMRFLRMSNP